MIFVYSSPVRFSGTCVPLHGRQDTRKGKFTAYTGKYEVIETDSNDTSVPAALANGSGGGGSSDPPAKVLPCSLEPATKELVELIFRWDLFLGIYRRFSHLHCKLYAVEG